jgi:hypothetical protein
VCVILSIIKFFQVHGSFYASNKTAHWIILFEFSNANDANSI